MTLSEMTPEQKRVAILEAMGFERWKSKSGRVYLIPPPEQSSREYWLSCGDAPTTDDITVPLDHRHPDPLTSLDAMHVAEKTLTIGQSVDYQRWLQQFVEVTHSNADGLIWHATAAQRADAFLLAIGAATP